MILLRNLLLSWRRDKPFVAILLCFRCLTVVFNDGRSAHRLLMFCDDLLGTHRIQERQLTECDKAGTAESESIFASFTGTAQ